MATKKKADQAEPVAEAEAQPENFGDQQSVGGQALTQAQLVDAVIKTGRHFQSVIDIGRELERIGNIRQSEKEATAHLINTQAALDDARLNIADVTRKLQAAAKELAEKDAIRAGWDAEVAAHEAKLIELRASIEALEARGEKTRKESEDTVEAANAMAKKMLDSANAVKLQATEVKRLAREEVDALKKELSAGRAEFADLQEKLAAAKAQIQNVFTGFGTLN